MEKELEQNTKQQAWEPNRGTVVGVGEVFFFRIPCPWASYNLFKLNDSKYRCNRGYRSHCSYTVSIVEY